MRVRYFDVCLFSCKPEIGEVHPVGELDYPGYASVKARFREGWLDEPIEFSHWEEHPIQVVAVVVLDSADRVIGVMEANESNLQPRTS